MQWDDYRLTDIFVAPCGLGMVETTRFEWLIHSRLDLIWAAAHPPLSLLDQRIWVSPLLGAGEPHPNKFCLNDWHAIVPRSMAPAYWLRWELMLQGSLPWTPHIEPGELLAGVLHVLELPLGEMDAVYCLEQVALEIPKEQGHRPGPGHGAAQRSASLAASGWGAAPGARKTTARGPSRREEV